MSGGRGEEANNPQVTLELNNQASKAANIAATLLRQAPLK